MIYNPEKHHRRSIRLKEYDYSLEGAYFVTVVCQNRENVFGTIKNGEMVLNDAGKMVETWWCKIPEKFPHTEIDEFVIMPNHFHGILSIVENLENENQLLDGDGCTRGRTPTATQSDKNTVGAVPCGRPYSVPCGRPYSVPCGPDLVNINKINGLKFQKNGLSGVVSWFKTMTTNEYIRNVKQNNWPPFNKSVWQKNYYEHVIRDDKDLMKIREYILYNPVNWESDENYKKERSCHIY